MRADFVANASHELRTPLNAVIGFSDLLSKAGLPDEQAATIAGLLLHESRQIPAVGQVFRFFGFRFEVLRRHPREVALTALARMGADLGMEGRPLVAHFAHVAHDQPARARQLGQQLGQSVLVDNRPGAVHDLLRDAVASPIALGIVAGWAMAAGLFALMRPMVTSYLHLEIGEPVFGPAVWAMSRALAPSRP